MSDKGVFTSEYCVVITSQIAIDALQWRKYMVDHWSHLTRENSIILVLAGVHGAPDGQVGGEDKGLLYDYMRQIEFLKTNKNSPVKEDIDRKNIQIVLEDVSEHMDNAVVDPKKIVEAVKRHKPTVIILAFCYTEKSDLNDILREAGIYTAMIMSKERGDITEGRCVELDPGQKKIIEVVEQYHKGNLDETMSGGKIPKNILLYGSSGTGKTLLLTELLKMRISYYKKRGERDIKVLIIVANEEAELLMKNLKAQDFGCLCEDKVTYHQGLKEWGVKQEELQKEIPSPSIRDPSETKLGYSVKSIHQFLQKVSSKSLTKTIILIDETELFVTRVQQDLRLLENEYNNVDLFMSLSPWVIGGQIEVFQVVAPKSRNIYSCQLLCRHRNSAKIYDFLCHNLQSKTGKAHGRLLFSALKSTNDKIDNVQRLPSGPEPMLIRRDEHVLLYSVLSKLKKYFKTDASKRSKSVGIVIMPGSSEIEAAVCSKWAKEDSENKTIVGNMSSIRGCEFDTLIVCGYEPFFIAELATRAREKLVFITTSGSDSDLLAKMQLTLSSRDASTDNCPLGTDCTTGGIFLKEIKKLDETDNNIRSDDESNCGLFCAAAWGQDEEVLKLSKEPGFDKIMSTFNESRLSPVHLAAAYNHVNVLKILLDGRSRLSNMQNNDGWSPLHCATSMNSVDASEFLCQQEGMDVNLTTSTGVTPLLNACLDGFDRCVQVLLRHPDIDVNKSDAKQQTPLMAAARHGHNTVLELLLKTSVDVNAVDSMGTTALCRAAAKGHVKATELLLAQPKIEVNKTSENSSCPLLQAAVCGHDDIAQMLLRHRDIDVNCTDEASFGGATALIVAAKFGHEKVMQSLLDQKYIDVNFVWKKTGSTALIEAVVNSHEKEVQLLLGHDDIDANFAWEKQGGLTPLMLAAGPFGNAVILKHLLAHPSIQINKTDENVISALIHAVIQGHQNIVKELLNHKDIDVNFACEKQSGLTPLMLAAGQFGNSVILKHLLAHPSIQIHKTDQYGKSALQYAYHFGHKEILAELLVTELMNVTQLSLK